MALIHCPECNSQISDKANTCPNCGYPMDSEMCLCPECGQRIFSDLDSCPQCGFPLQELEQAEPEKIQCPECGQRIPADTEDCPNCGYPLAELAPIPVQAPYPQKKIRVILTIIAVVLILSGTLWAFRAFLVPALSHGDEESSESQESYSAIEEVSDNEEQESLNDAQEESMENLSSSSKPDEEILNDGTEEQEVSSSSNSNVIPEQNTEEESTPSTPEDWNMPFDSNGNYVDPAKNDIHLSYVSNYEDTANYFDFELTRVAARKRDNGVRIVVSYNASDAVRVIYFDPPNGNTVSSWGTGGAGNNSFGFNLTKSQLENISELTIRFWKGQDTLDTQQYPDNYIVLEEDAIADMLALLE